MSNGKIAFLLAALCVFSFAIRLHHINFPAIGYHNMKENGFIKMARIMERSGDYLSRQIDFPGGHFTAWQTVACRIVAGETHFLGLARTINVLYFMIAMIYAFRISVLLTGSQPVGLITAFLLGIIPLGNFFSRNLQPESPSFLFMLMAIFHGLCLVQEYRLRNLLALAVSMVMIALCKLTFFIGLIPLLFVISYGKYFTKAFAGKVLKGLCFVLMPLAVLLFLFKEEMIFSDLSSRVDLFRVFSGEYWRKFGPILFGYAVRENFTWFYAIVGVFGAIGVLMKGSDSFLRRFISGWGIALVLYVIVFSDFINQHNYYQMPFLFPLAFCSAYFLWHAALAINKILKNRVGYVLMVGFLLISLPGVFAATMASYDFVLFGQDVAGDYLNKHVPAGKTFIHFTGNQGYGVCTYADRDYTWPRDLDDLKRKERELGIEYISVFTFTYFGTLDPDIKKYIETNYHIVHIGFTANQEAGFAPWTLVLKKGGSFNMDEFMKRTPLRLAKVYEMWKGVVPFLVAEE